MPKLANLKPVFVACWLRAIRECRGTFAIEFALILPLMIVLFIGAVEVGNALTVWRRTDQVAYTAADLVAQARSLSGEQVGNITKAADSILAPYPTKALSIVLTSVVADEKNRTKVDWSCKYGSGGAARPKGSPVTLPEGLTEPGSSVIMAEVRYDYSPLLGPESGYKIFDMNLTQFDMSRTFYSRPRRSKTVEKTDSGCGSAPTS
jgi:Flp pilus assembly protein TadG